MDFGMVRMRVAGQNVRDNKKISYAGFEIQLVLRRFSVAEIIIFWSRFKSRINSHPTNNNRRHVGNTYCQW
jgi:hypothetical protein